MNLASTFPLSLIIYFCLILPHGQIFNTLNNKLNNKLNVYALSPANRLSNLLIANADQSLEELTNEELTDDRLLSDGIYFYGQTTIPEQLLHEYFIFAVKQHKVIGAFYLPKSAFYCFYGVNKPAKLDIVVVDNFNRTTAPYLVNLTEYYAIPTISENDQRILNTCIDSYQNMIW